MATITKGLAIVAGVGPGTGAAVAKKFGEFYNVVLLARSPESYSATVDEIKAAGGSAIGINTDITDEKSVKNAFAEAEKAFPGSNLAAAIFNVGGRFVRKPFLEIDPADVQYNIQANAIGGVYFAQAALPSLIATSKLKSTALPNPPTLIFTGATASVKGSPQCEAFSPGKFALRSLTQSLAKEFGPQGVHVSHIVVDGVIDIARTAAYVFKDEDAKISTTAIADTYWHLHAQPRTTWTWELDIRPYVEKW